MNKLHAIPFAILLVSAAISMYYLPMMPDMMVTHWGFFGEANGFMPKLLGIFIMPLMSAFLLAIFLLIPHLDPKKENIESFRIYYDYFLVLMMAFMFYMHILVIVWNLGVQFNMSQAMAPAFASLMFYMGVLVQNAKLNWSIGIRNPWTLSSEHVWEKTHNLAGVLFKVSGLIALAGLLFPGVAMLLSLVSVITSAIVAVVFSFVVYQLERLKHMKSGSEATTEIEELENKVFSSPAKKSSGSVKKKAIKARPTKKKSASAGSSKKKTQKGKSKKR